MAFHDNVIILSANFIARKEVRNNGTNKDFYEGGEGKDCGYPVYKGKGRRLDRNYQRIDEVKR